MIFRSWRGLQFEANFLKEVFGAPATPEDLLQDLVKESRKTRLARAAL